MAKKNVTVNTKKQKENIEEPLKVEATLLCEGEVIPDIKVEEAPVIDVAPEVVENTIETLGTEPPELTPEPLEEPSIDFNQIHEEVNFEFQKDYQIGGGDPTKEAEIDELPMEEPIVDDAKTIIGDVADENGFYNAEPKEINLHIDENIINDINDIHRTDIIDDAKEMITQSFDEPVKINIVVEKPRRTVKDLSVSELRTYKRTGIIRQ